MSDNNRECNCMVPYLDGAGVHHPRCNAVRNLPDKRQPEDIKTRFTRTQKEELARWGYRFTNDLVGEAAYKEILTGQWSIVTPSSYQPHVVEISDPIAYLGTY